MSEKSQLIELQSQVAEMLNKDQIDSDTPLGELGIDSLNVVEVILICEQLYTDVSDPEALIFDEFTTLRDMDAQLLEASDNFV
ncbi:acyl carrier protein [Pseudoalteromonas denitrificans]|uniref:Phosphopantetheine attachment site n=1 Tax=Pseudoalteromonas denitrificans DSM 6059 TaxID=1123010 RepID=A0A1I1I7P7_9GAMM|nr:acyl carrier protein [Pseudoalteromonas denitrificans]SFC32194.1 Phosphopantetheine attachment site [Pseudoalteromonas denitrificans DSM 6059]